MIDLHGQFEQCSGLFQPSAIRAHQATWAVTDVSTTTSGPVEPGDSVRVDASAINHGPGSGQQSFTITVNGSSAGSVSFDGAVGATDDDSAFVDAPDASSMTVCVSGQCFSLGVEAPPEPEPDPDPAEIVVDGISVTPSTVNTGDAVHVVLDVHNAGDLSGSRSIDVLVDGSTATTLTASLAGGEQRTLGGQVVIDSPGTHTISAGSESATVEARATTEINLTCTGLPAQAMAGEPITIEYDAANPSSVPVIFEPAVLANGEEFFVGGQREVAAGDSRSLDVDVTAPTVASTTSLHIQLEERNVRRA